MLNDIKEGDLVVVLPNPYRVPVGKAVCSYSDSLIKLAFVEKHNNPQQWVIPWKYLEPINDVESNEPSSQPYLEAYA